MKEALAQVRPASQTQFEARFAELERELVALDRDLQVAFAPLAGKLLLASHPIYHYLARRYGLDLVSFAWEPDEVPGAAEWRTLEHTLKGRPGRWMLWERAPLPASVSRLKALGVGVVVFDPSPNVPASGDFMTVMRQNLANVRAAAGR